MAQTLSMVVSRLQSDAPLVDDASLHTIALFMH